MNEVYRKPLRLLLFVVSVEALGLTAVAGAEKVLPLPQEDRERLESWLGKGVVGKAMAAPTIANPAVFLNLAQRPSWTFRHTHGARRGTIDKHTIGNRKTASGVATWQADGPMASVHLMKEKDGSVKATGDVDRKEKVVSRYSPPEPILLANLKPGDVKRSRHAVKVYNLGNLAKVSYRGHLDLVYTYVGAYEVTVPAGKFKAVLIKWKYKGKIGPSSIENTQYCILAEGIGPIALIEKFDASAFLVYQNHSKTGKVLEAFSTAR